MIDFELTSTRPDPYSIKWTLRPIRQGGGSVNQMNQTIPVTRCERAEALADLYEVPLADLYRRYGAALLPTHRVTGAPAIQETEGRLVGVAGA
jgi:hypothetical protein